MATNGSSDSTRDQRVAAVCQSGNDGASAWGSLSTSAKFLVGQAPGRTHQRRFHGPLEVSRLHLVLWLIWLQFAVCLVAVPTGARAQEPLFEDPAYMLAVHFLEDDLEPELPAPHVAAPPPDATPADSTGQPTGSTEAGLLVAPIDFESEIADGMFAEDEIAAPEGSTDVEIPAPVYNTESWFRNGNWYTQQDFVMMGQRRLSRGTVPYATGFIFSPGSSGFRKGILAYDTFASFSISRFSRNLNIDSLFLQFEPGTRLTLGRLAGRDAANRDYAMEITYLGLFEWKSRADFAGIQSVLGAPAGSIRTVFGGVVADPAGQPTAIFVPGFSDADIQRFQYTTDFNSLEWNLRIQGRPDRDILALQPDGAWIRHDSSGRLVSVLGGLRFVSINDSFILQSEAAATPASPATFGLYRARTHNDMVGAQMGLELMEKYTQWNWGFRSRIAAMSNFGERISQISTVNGIDPRFQIVDDVNFVPLLEGGLFTAYQLRPNVTLRGAYDVLFLVSGTADVQRNLSLQPTFPPLNMTGRRLLQGLSVGFEAVW